MTKATKSTKNQAADFEEKNKKNYCFNGLTKIGRMTQTTQTGSSSPSVTDGGTACS